MVVVTDVVVGDRVVVGAGWVTGAEAAGRGLVDVGAARRAPPPSPPQAARALQMTQPAHRLLRRPSPPIVPTMPHGRPWRDHGPVGGSLVRDGLELLFVVAVGGMLWTAVGRLRAGSIRIYRCGRCSGPTSRAYPNCTRCGAPLP